VVELPIPVGSYTGLAATEKTLFYLSFPVRGMVEEQEGGDNPRAS
jgi:hypothetical protein